MAATLIHGDCLKVLRARAAESVDAIVTDPPAGIAFMGKEWDDFRRARNPADVGRDNVFGRTSAKGPEYGRRGREQFIQWLTAIMAEGLRVLKPGGYAFVWALPRTSHWTATALEDAGFEIRDVIVHVFGSGFPKSKALMKPASEHWILCRKPGPLRHLRIDDCRVGTDVRTNPAGVLGTNTYGRMERNESFTVAAGRWPANLIMSHARGCKRVGTQRVPSNGHHPGRRGSAGMWSGEGGGLDGTEGGERYMGNGGTEEVPAYRCAEGCPVALMDAQSGILKSGVLAPHHNAKPSTGWSGGSRAGRIKGTFGGDTGTASRFFHCFEADPFVYQAKASRKDRGEGNKHPTVKSTALMRHLCRLIAAPGDLVLDMFAGSGSTGVAALTEGMRFIGIEQDAKSVKTARRRLRAPRSAAAVTPPRRAAA